MPESRSALSSPDAVAVGPYSHAVVHDGLVYCSGQTPLDPSTGRLADGGIAAQTRQCFTNLLAVLDDANLSGADVLKVNVFLTDMADFADMNAVYMTIFDEPFPARTTIGVAGLPLGANIEIELIARTRSTS